MTAVHARVQRARPARLGSGLMACRAASCAACCGRDGADGRPLGVAVEWRRSGSDRRGALRARRSSWSTPGGAVAADRPRGCRRRPFGSTPVTPGTYQLRAASSKASNRLRRVSASAPAAPSTTEAACSTSPSICPGDHRSATPRPSVSPRSSSNVDAVSHRSEHARVACPVLRSRLHRDGVALSRSGGRSGPAA